MEIIRLESSGYGKILMILLRKLVETLKNLNYNFLFILTLVPPFTYLTCNLLSNRPGTVLDAGDCRANMHIVFVLEALTVY